MKPDLRLAGTAVGCWVACLVVARLSWPAGAVIAGIALALAMAAVGASQLGQGDARWVVIGVLADKILFSPWERFLYRRWGTAKD